MIIKHNGLEKHTHIRDAERPFLLNDLFVKHLYEASASEDRVVQLSAEQERHLYKLYKCP